MLIKVPKVIHRLDIFDEVVNKYLVSKYGDEFREIFDAEIEQFADTPLFFLGFPEFDMEKFEEFITKRGYRKNNGNLADYILKNYGEKGKKLFDKLLNIEEY